MAIPPIPRKTAGTGEIVEWPESRRRSLGPAQAQGRHQVQAEQVAGVRGGRPRAANPGRTVVEYRQVARQAIAMHGVEDQHVALPPQAAVEVQQASLGQGEQGLAAPMGPG